jgi:hypothetical protein
VRDYEDQRTPVVGFSAIALDAKTEQVVWESTSQNDGDDSQWLFGTGTVSTANVLVCRMARAVVAQMLHRRAPGRRASAARGRARATWTRLQGAGVAHVRGVGDRETHETTASWR